MNRVDAFIATLPQDLRLQLENFIKAYANINDSEKKTTSQKRAETEIRSYLRYFDSQDTNYANPHNYSNELSNITRAFCMFNATNLGLALLDTVPEEKRGAIIYLAQSLLYKKSGDHKQQFHALERALKATPKAYLEEITAIEELLEYEETHQEPRAAYLAYQVSEDALQKNLGYNNTPLSPETFLPRLAKALYKNEYTLEALEIVQRTKSLYGQHGADSTLMAVFYMQANDIVTTYKKIEQARAALKQNPHDYFKKELEEFCKENHL